MATKAELRSQLFSTPSNTVFAHAHGVTIHLPTIAQWNRMAGEAQTEDGGMDQAKLQWLIALNLCRCGDAPDSEQVFEPTDEETFMSMPINHPIYQVSRRALEAFNAASADLAKNA